MMICQHSACSDDKKEEGGEMDCSTCYKQIQMMIIIYISIYLLIEQFWVISFYSQGKKKVSKTNLSSYLVIFILTKDLVTIKMLVLS